VKIEKKEKTISGVVLWEDEKEEQNFSWNPPEEISNITNISKIINFIRTNKYIDGDRITISRKDLEKIICIPGCDSRKIKESIDDLCAIRIGMIDKAEITDYYLVHF
jgi:hypothetical protein